MLCLYSVRSNEESAKNVKKNILALPSSRTSNTLHSCFLIYIVKKLIKRPDPINEKSFQGDENILYTSFFFPIQKIFVVLHEG